MNREGYQQRGLYDPAFEHDACGIGAVVDIKGRQSYETVDSALKIVEKLEHRAGKDAEGKTGDGVGILLQISHQFFSEGGHGVRHPAGGGARLWRRYVFLSQDTLRRNQAKKMFEVIVAKEGMEFLGWRKVPVCPEVLGQKALSKMPNIQQAFVKRPGDAARGLEFDRRLYVARRVFEQSNDNTYVPPCPAGQWYIRGCSWWGNCGSSTWTCRVGTTTAPSHAFTPLLHQHQSLLGAGPPLTA